MNYLPGLVILSFLTSLTNLLLLVSYHPLFTFPPVVSGDYLVYNSTRFIQAEYCSGGTAIDNLLNNITLIVIHYRYAAFPALLVWVAIRLAGAGRTFGSGTVII
jgi:hypothetical protein